MIHAMMLVRNEADRWLSNVMGQLKDIADRIVILDDCSTDQTKDICLRYGVEMHQTANNLWTTDERAARSYLFEQTCKSAKNNDWIVCLDADELLVDDHIPYLEYILDVMPEYIDAIGFRLFDMWSDTHYRDDKWWTAHARIWPMIVRYKEGFNYQWLDKKLHCGRFPANSSLQCYPTMIPIKHMGWSRPEYRIAKYNLYMQTDPDGKDGILEQYHSIIDEQPKLKMFGGVL